MLVAPAVEQPPLATPPTSPVHGCCYIVAASPSGAWSGKADCLAVFICGGWRFVMPADGVTAYVRSTRSLAIYRHGEWALSAGSICFFGGRHDGRLSGAVGHRSKCSARYVNTG